MPFAMQKYCFLTYRRDVLNYLRTTSLTGQQGLLKKVRTKHSEVRL